MKNVLARGQAEVLDGLARARSLLAFDFDGTLAPIVSDRHRAHLRTSTAALFRRLCGAYPCAVISGRAVADVSVRLEGAPVRYVMGNHGLEPGPSLRAFSRELREVLPVLEAALAKVPGVEVEDKRYSLAVHFRRSRRQSLALAAIHEAVARLSLPLREIPGKCVVNLVPSRAPNKGSALLKLRERVGAEVALFVGDDATDEDVFRLARPGRLVSVRVGRSSRSSASFFLASQRDLDVLLKRLLEARA